MLAPAFAIVSGYLGLNMLSRLTPALSQPEALFQLLEQVAPTRAVVR